MGVNPEIGSSSITLVSIRWGSEEGSLGSDTMRADVARAQRCVCG